MNATQRIGSIEVTVVSDGRLSLPVDQMFGPAQSAEWRQLVELESGKVPFSVNCLLARVGERKLLFDTGTGRDEPLLMARYGDHCGRLVDNLRALGIAPGDIDTVVLSHAHGDHIGGATVLGPDGPRPTFPNADYWLWRGEWEYWTQPEQLAQRPFLQRKLQPLAMHGRLQLADGEIEVAPGVRLIASPGHTPGHVCVAMTSGREMAIYTGDLLHHAAQLEHPEWSPAFDLLPEQSAASRRRILTQALRDRAVLLTAHLAAPGVVCPGLERWETA